MTERQSGPPTLPVGGRGAAVASPEAIVARTRSLMEAHWQPEGYTVPNTAVYPHQWLWDSCFHAVIWAHLGEADRAVAELRNLFAHQADDGFVPHMTYWRAPDLHASFWGRRTTSSITQPPMYGHALAELHRLGIDVDAELLARARAGLGFLAARRADGAGRTVIVHPWESGCDDSPRWDAWCPGGWDPVRWKAVKGELVAAVHLDPVTGSPVGSDRFAVGSAMFTALTAFNARELATVPGAGPRLDAVPGRPPADPTADVAPSGGGPADGVPPGPPVRTAEVLLGVLTVDEEGDTGGTALDPGAVFAALADPAGFGGACGPAQVHRSESAFDPATYWRGPAWPQLTYLFWVAARRLGRAADAAWLRDALLRGADTSGFAEYWHPDSGAGLGAVPQSWAGLAAVVATT